MFQTPMQQGQGAVLNVPAYFTAPQSCANCCAPAQTTLAVAREIRKLGRRITRTYSIPHCHSCAARTNAHGKKRSLLGLLVFGVALVLSLVGFLLPGLPGEVLVVVPVVATLIAGIVAYVVLIPKKADAPASSSVEAISLLAFNDAMATFYCANAKWATEAATLNQGHVTPTKSRTMYRAWAHPVFGSVLALVGAGIVFAVAHPKVCLDNPTKNDVQFWMDDERLKVVSAGRYALEDLPHGDHTFGWSKVGASKPEGTVEGSVAIGDAHLVNAYEAGCYWIEGAVYGSAKMKDSFKPGPQPLLGFYAFDKVDVWFGSLPTSVRTKSSGETRVAVNSYKMCTNLRGSCPDAMIKEALACDAKTDDEAQASSCWSACLRRSRP